MQISVNKKIAKNIYIFNIAQLSFRRPKRDMNVKDTFLLSHWIYIMKILITPPGFL